MVVLYFVFFGSHFSLLKTSKNALKHMVLSFKMKGDVILLWDFISGSAFGLLELKQLVQDLSGPSPHVKMLYLRSNSLQ